MSIFVLTTILSFAGFERPTSAGLLNPSNAANTPYQGTVSFNFSDPKIGQLDIAVDYEVFTPHNFSSSFLGSALDQKYGSDYVYAYQIFNNSPSTGGLGLLGLSIGFNPDLYSNTPKTGPIGPIDTVVEFSNGDQSSVAATALILETDATLFDYHLAGSNALAPGMHSQYLIEASSARPFGPDLSVTPGYGSYVVAGIGGSGEYISSPFAYSPNGDGTLGSASTPLASSWEQLCVLTVLFASFSILRWVFTGRKSFRRIQVAGN